MMKLLRRAAGASAHGGVIRRMAPMRQCCQRTTRLSSRASARDVMRYERRMLMSALRYRAACHMRFIIWQPARARRESQAVVSGNERARASEVA